MSIDSKKYAESYARLHSAGRRSESYTSGGSDESDVSSAFNRLDGGIQAAMLDESGIKYAQVVTDFVDSIGRLLVDRNDPFAPKRMEGTVEALAKLPAEKRDFLHRGLLMQVMVFVDEPVEDGSYAAELRQGNIQKVYDAANIINQASYRSSEETN